MWGRVVWAGQVVCVCLELVGRCGFGGVLVFIVWACRCGRIGGVGTCVYGWVWGLVNV